MATANISKVYLLSVPLEIDYKNTLYFDTKASQESYFTSKVLKSYTDFTYLRKDNLIYVPACYDDIYKANYVMYQNSNYNNKWFYAFIKDMKYENDECTIIEIETDVMQTWMFDYTIKPSFVEREHVSDDSVGLHRVPETLETGDYIDQLPTTNEMYFADYLDECYIVLGLSETGGALPDGQKLYNGVYSALHYLVFATPRDCERYIKGIQDEITEDVIYTAFMIPKTLIDSKVEIEWITGDSATNDIVTGEPVGLTYEYAYLPYSESSVTMNIEMISKTNYIDKDYVPRNKKLLTFPYKYLMISNNAGNSNVYHYEDFRDSENCRFSLEGAVAPGCSIRLIPMEYKMQEGGFDHTYLNIAESLDAAKLPICGWTNDAYTNWLTQNSVNHVTTLIGGLGMTLVGGVMTYTGIGAGVGAGMIGTGALMVGNLLTQRYERALTPESARGGINQGDLNFAMKKTFSIYKKSIRKEMAMIIDGYFDMYGYQVNCVKVPNKNHRSRWWFTKTIDINIDGSLPQNDLQKIKDCYNKGITFWKNASEIQNYSLSNEIV